VIRDKNGGAWAMSDERRQGRTSNIMLRASEEPAVDNVPENKSLSSAEQRAKIMPELNKDSLVQGIILSEILGKPRARRMRRQTRRRR
jgi:hypothetical protein